MKSLGAWIIFMLPRETARDVCEWVSKHCGPFACLNLKVKYGKNGKKGKK